MTPLTLRTQFENLIDDAHDITHTYQLLTQAKNYIEVMMKLQILQNANSSQTASPGDTYLTLKSLPTDFRQMIKVYVDTIEYFPIPFAQRIAFRNAARRYYIDYKRQVAGSTALGLCGSIGTAKTINQIYMVKTDDLTEANEETDGVILWPDEFQPIIPYQAAKIFQANLDADDTSFRMSGQQEVEFQRLWDAMTAWDHDIKLASMGGQLGYASEHMEGEYPFDVGSINQ